MAFTLHVPRQTASSPKRRRVGPLFGNVGDPSQGHRRDRTVRRTPTSSPLCPRYPDAGVPRDPRTVHGHRAIHRIHLLALYHAEEHGRGQRGSRGPPHTASTHGATHSVRAQDESETVWDSVIPDSCGGGEPMDRKHLRRSGARALGTHDGPLLRPRNRLPVIASMTD